MNYDQALQLFFQVLSASGMIVHPSLLKELLGICSGSGQEATIKKALAARLQRLAAYPGSAHIKFPESFERLRNAGDLYSMRIPTSNHNVRVLYGYSGDNICLLLAFNEKAGKGNTDYSSHIEPARSRLAELIEE